MSDDALAALRALDERRRHLAGSRKPLAARGARANVLGNNNMPESQSRKRVRGHESRESGDATTKRPRATLASAPTRSRGGRGGGRRGSGNSGRRRVGGASGQNNNSQDAQSDKKLADVVDDAQAPTDDRPRASVPAVVQGRNRRMFGALLGHLRSAKESTEGDQRMRKAQVTRMQDVTRRHDEEGDRLREIEVRTCSLVLDNVVM
jgi:hypothetical protein